MRNKYPGICYKCGKPVKPDDGYFERHKGGWRVQHIGCKGVEPSFIPIEQIFSADDFEAQTQ
jgi:hypothetical protein